MNFNLDETLERQVKAALPELYGPRPNVQSPAKNS
jgi:hypothetical protein